MTEAIPVTGVNEVTLETIDLPRAERFYTEVLGFPVLERWEGSHWTGREAVWVLAGSTRIGLWKPGLGISRARPGVHVHYAMSVAADAYDDVVATLRSRGAAVDEVEFGGRKARSAYVMDPDGHVVEFWTWDVRKGNPGPPVAVSENVFGVPKSL
ncbi:VOC family protein [Amycolatopsis minnesotensis]|uniref:FosA family fosfomycin resistance glutathione transferase n=1 Tax=Amycolatopsis minnesotensis TaxID=337894 RepID=A0ABN2Q2B6_9PSEU